MYLLFFVVKHYDRTEYNLNNMQSYAEKICEIGDVPGMSVAIWNEGEESYINVGNANAQELMTNETLCELGSTTKAFTAVGIILLEQDGLLNRNDTVSQYLPWFQPTYRDKKVEISIEQLLCHTGGIPSWTIAKIPQGTAAEENLLENTVKTVQNIELVNKPGVRQHYATINYDVLALIIEKVSGMKYETYIEENILQPLGMYESYFGVNDVPNESVAQGYRYAFLDASPYKAPTYYGNTASGYLVSNTSELMVWLKAQNGVFDMLKTDKVHRVANAIEAVKGYEDTRVLPYFAGWNFHGSYISHSGNNPNYSSQVIVATEDERAVCALANINGTATTKAAEGIYRMLQGETVRIGFWIDGTQLLDFFCVVIVIFELLIAIHILQKDRKQLVYYSFAGLGATLACLVILLMPYLLHYNYKTIAVWCTPSLLVAMLGAVVCFVLEGYIAKMKYIRI